MNATAAVLLVFAALFGAAGTAAAAAAAHGDDPRLIAIAAGILLAQAPALLAMAGLDARLLRLRALAGALLILGTVLFSGDLAMRHVFGDRLFAMAAPSGGVAMIAGWIVLGIGAMIAAIARRRA